MEQFFADHFKDLDTTVLFALGLILATAGTSLVSIICNLETWFGHPNPLRHTDTDSLMPIMAAIQGSAYGLFLGPAPGWSDNVKSAILYGGATVLVYLMVKKAMTLWGPRQDAGKPS